MSADSSRGNGAPHQHRRNGTRPDRHHGHTPLVDTAALRELEEQLFEARLSRRFIAAYITMWETRIDRLCAAVHAGNPVRAIDAVLSLKTASSMAGAVRLTILAQAHEAAIRRLDFATARGQLELIKCCGTATMNWLDAHYLAPFRSKPQ